MSRAVAGNVYYAIIEGKRCKCIFIRQCEDHIQNQTFYLLAIPAKKEEERAIEVRDAEGIIFCVKVVAGPKLTFPKTPKAGQQYQDRGERIPPTDSLLELMNQPEALPPRVNAENVVELVLSEAEQDEPALDQEHEANFEVMRLFAAVPPKNNANAANSEQNSAQEPNNANGVGNPSNSVSNDAASQLILSALTTITSRLDSLESRNPLVPPQASGTVHRNPAYAGAFGDCDLEAELERAKDAAPLRHPSNTITPPPPAIAQPTIAAASSLDPALVDWMKSISEAVVHRQGAMSASQAQLFKLHGAKGRVAQDQLNRDFNSNPQGVVEGFEEAVLRRAGAHDRVGAGGSAGAAAADVLLDTWRDTVPAREAQSTARIGEAVIDAYCAIRRGDPMRGAARLALLIGAMEQCTLDNYRWHPRASTMTGMPPLPMQRYQALPAEAKKGQDAGAKKLGEMAQLCDPVRATTALAVHKDAEA